MKTVRVYTPSELKRKYPDGFERAHEWFNSGNDQIPWQEEIMDSFKAVFEYSDVRIKDWNISGDSPSSSHVYFEFYNDDAAGLTGQRALAWLENNLFAKLREKRTFVNRVKNYSSKWYDFTKYGEIPSCPFTGVCFDEDFIESLLKSIKSGDTLGEAYSDLARVAGKLFEAEIEDQNSEERFLEQEDMHFTKEGTFVR